MKQTAIILSGFTILFFMNCGQSTDFQSDSQFKSLADGETVEVIPNEELDAMNNEGDSGIVDGDGSNGGMSSNDGGTQNNDGGLSSNDDDDSYSGPGNSGGRSVDKDDNDDEDSKGNGHRGMSCRERLLDQDKNKEHGNMVTSPKEMESDKDMFEATRCGDNGRKVLVCHFPNADYSKRKTLCIGRPALEAHINHLGAQRGSEHVDYAGPCKDLEGNIADGDHSQRSDDGEKTKTAKFDFSGRQ